MKISIRKSPGKPQKMLPSHDKLVLNTHRQHAREVNANRFDNKLLLRTHVAEIVSRNYLKTAYLKKIRATEYPATPE
jgi:hypothetical protein